MGIKTLLLDPTYREYASLPCLPYMSVDFEEEEDGTLIIHQGELFCRARHSSGEFCGRKFSDRGNLILHVRNLHQYRPAPAQTGRSSVKREQDSLNFFRAVMRIHHLASSGGPEQAMQLALETFPRRHVSNTLPTCSGSNTQPPVASSPPVQGPGSLPPLASLPLRSPVTPIIEEIVPSTIGSIEPVENMSRTRSTYTSPSRQPTPSNGVSKEQGISQSSSPLSCPPQSPPPSPSLPVVAEASSQSVSAKHAKNTLQTRSIVKLPKIRKVPSVAVPAPRYKAGKCKGMVNYNECTRYLKSKGIVTTCPKCSSEKLKACSLQLRCANRRFFLWT